MKTKVRLVSHKQVGYIDGYIANDGVYLACVVIGNKIVVTNVNLLTVIDEDTFNKEDQNTFITVQSKETT